jgi:hypothetical protein
MAKRSDSTFYNKPTLEPPKLDIDPKPSITYNKVTNLIPSRVIRYGKVSGTRYEWQPGQTINVLSEDTDELRNLKLGGRPCCAGGDANSMFQVLED